MTSFKHTPICVASAPGHWSIDTAHLKKAKGLDPSPWSGPIGRFGTVRGVVFYRGSNVELLFVGDYQGEIGPVCTEGWTETFIRPMIGTSGTGPATTAESNEWVPDDTELTIRGLTLTPYHDGNFQGTAIVSIANGALVAFFSGDGVRSDVCSLSS